MKHYYYAKQDVQFGPFTIEELKDKKLKKSTLVWTEGMTDWMTAESIDELNHILIAEPPPLPKRKSEPKKERVVELKQRSIFKTNSKFDPSYSKEIGATVIGVLLLALPIVLKEIGFLTFDNTEDFKNTRGVLLIISFIIRILVTLWVIEIAKNQNRNPKLWGWFAFFLPSIALIIIGLLKKLKFKIKVDNSLSKNEKITYLLEKANDLVSKKRYADSLEVANYLCTLDSSNLECHKIRGLSNYYLKNFNDAQKDFELLIKSESYLPEVYFYMGNINIQKFNRESAVEFWKKAKALGNQKSDRMLDMYDTYSGKYLLDKSQIQKKLSSYSDFNFSNIKYIKGIEEVESLEKKSKFNPEMKIYENGIEIQLRKMFKIHHVGIAFYEMDDISYNKVDRELTFKLKDEVTLDFKCDISLTFLIGENQLFSNICRGFKNKNGRLPSISTYLKD